MVLTLKYWLFLVLHSHSQFAGKSIVKPLEFHLMHVYGHLAHGRHSSCYFKYAF